MIKKLNIILILIFSPTIIYGQQSDSIQLKRTLEEVSINAIRANEKTPIAY